MCDTFVFIVRSAMLRRTNIGECLSIPMSHCMIDECAAEYLSAIQRLGSCSTVAWVMGEASRVKITKNHTRRTQVAASE